MTKKLRYYPKKHTYYYGRKKLTSVTTLIGQFFKPFDAKLIARELSKFPQNRSQKHGVRWFLNSWKESADHGTRVHELVEKYIKIPDMEIPDVFTEQDLSKFEQALNYLEGVTGKKDSEVKVYDEKLGLAGTVDLVVQDGKGGITIIDWKTNKAINQKAYKGEHTLPPLELEDCNYNKYALQLSTYAYILEQNYGICNKIKIKDLVLVHLKEDGYKEYKVPYMKKEVKQMLEAIQNEQNE